METPNLHKSCCILKLTNMAAKNRSRKTNTHMFTTCTPGLGGCDARPSARPASQTLYRVHRDLKLSILAFPTEYKRLRRAADQTEARCRVPANQYRREEAVRADHPPMIANLSSHFCH